MSDVPDYDTYSGWWRTGCRNCQEHM